MIPNLMGMINPLLAQLVNNPMQFIMQLGFNIPQNISNDPNAIIQYLMNSGQASQTQYNTAVQTANMMGRRQF